MLLRFCNVYIHNYSLLVYLEIDSEKILLVGTPYAFLPTHTVKHQLAGRDDVAARVELHIMTSS
jgi:hypothetical protein